MRYVWSTRIPTFYNGYKKIAVKMTADSWVGIDDKAIILLSIHSAFNQQEKGQLNVTSLIGIIKKQFKGLITILLSDSAHLNVLTLAYNNRQKAFEIAKNDALALAQKFSAAFQECHVVLWSDFINRDPHYQTCVNQIAHLYEHNNYFRGLIQDDAQSTYTLARAQEFPDKNAYLRSTIDDLLEQCAYTLVVAAKEYRFEFYPGRQYESIYFVNSRLLSVDKQLTHVHVNISFEKK